MQICLYEDCDKKAISKGLCSNHYEQERRNSTSGLPCNNESCDSGKSQYAKGLCHQCYNRNYNTGTTDRQVARKGEPVKWLTALSLEESDGACRDWPFGTSNKYGAVHIEGKSMTASRASLVISTGINPEGLFCRHSCHRPSCVAPWHLSWGTPDDNFYDIIRRVITLHEEGLSEDEIIQQFKETWN